MVNDNNICREVEQMAEQIIVYRKNEEKAIALAQSVEDKRKEMWGGIYSAWQQATNDLLDIGAKIIHRAGAKPFSAFLETGCSGSDCRGDVYVKPSGKIKIESYHVDRLSRIATMGFCEVCPSSLGTYHLLINPAKNSVNITWRDMRLSPPKAVTYAAGSLLNVMLTLYEISRKKDSPTFKQHVSMIQRHLMPPCASYKPGQLLKKLQKQMDSGEDRKAERAEHFLNEYLGLPEHMGDVLRFCEAVRGEREIEREKERKLEMKLRDLETEKSELERKALSF
jgi:hypothetical protein